MMKNKRYIIKEKDSDPSVVQDDSTISYSADISVEEVETIDETEAVIQQLREKLHPSTVQMLDSVGWMTNMPFPSGVSADDESWIDEAEAQGNSDIVPDVIIQQDLAAWRSVR